MDVPTWPSPTLGPLIWIKYLSTCVAHPILLIFPCSLPSPSFLSALSLVLAFFSFPARERLLARFCKAVKPPSQLADHSLLAFALCAAVTALALSLHSPTRPRAHFAHLAHHLALYHGLRHQRWLA